MSEPRQQPADQEVQVAQAEQGEHVGAEHEVRVPGQPEDRGNRVQRERQVRSGLEALLRVLLQAAQYYSLQTRGCLGRKFRDRRGFLVQDRAHRVGRCRPAERSLPHHHLVQDRAEGKNISAMIGRQSPHLFRRHVAHSSHRYARDGQRRRHIRQGFLRLHYLRQPEVQNLDTPVFGDE